jgi:hypothetical protein
MKYDKGTKFVAAFLKIVKGSYHAICKNIYFLACSLSTPSDPLRDLRVREVSRKIKKEDVIIPDDNNT